MSEKKKRVRKPSSSGKRPGRKPKTTEVVGPIRKLIHKAMKDQELSGYDLVEKLKGQVSRTAVYRFLAGGASTTCETLEKFLEVLKIEIVAK